MASHKLTLQVEGMSCASCAGRVERALTNVPGVIEASVNLAAETASVTWTADRLSGNEIARYVSDAGYPAHPVTDDTTSERLERKSGEAQMLARMTTLSAIMTFPIFVVEMGGHFIPGVHAWVEANIGIQNSWLVQFILTTLILLGPGLGIFRNGIAGLARRAPDMDALVVLGTSAAWLYSSIALFAPMVLPEASRVVYFEAAAVIVTLILLGRWLEAGAKGRTGAAIRALLNLQPGLAMVKRDDAWSECPVEEIVQGDQLQVRPGERIATDGIVTSGASFVDESMITGEPVPEEKTIGSALVGGTLNGNGALYMEATAVGSETVLASIVRLVEEAQGAKLPIQTLVDRIVMWFVPAVLVAAVVTVLAWLFFGPAPALTFALVTGVSVLIVACPCAMGLATPTSVMVGSGRAAELGALFRKGDALQSLTDVSVVAFDKTGTLTAGRPELTDLVTRAGAEDRVLSQVAALEALSEHPIADAITRAALARGLVLDQISDFSAIPGMGARGKIADSEILVGADRLMEQQGIDISEYSAQADALARSGGSPLFAAIDGHAVALIGVSDPVKPTSRKVVKALQDMGLRVAMITGDNAKTAVSIAAELGITDVTAEVLPDAKAAAVQALKGQFGKVAFVGDGINDAPALAAADIGVAIGTGTDVAIETADIVLMSGELEGVRRAILVSQMTMRNIRQNLFWAFAYNTALIPVAAGVLYPLTGVLLSPMLAAAAMALSSVFVLSNALRLRNMRVEAL